MLETHFISELNSSQLAMLERNITLKLMCEMILAGKYPVLKEKQLAAIVLVFVLR